jgi:hypothetical protein
MILFVTFITTNQVRKSKTRTLISYVEKVIPDGSKLLIPSACVLHRLMPPEGGVA